jgi:hypothetical protein
MDSVVAQLKKEKESAQKNIENLRNSINNSCAIIKVRQMLITLDSLFSAINMYHKCTDSKNIQESKYFIQFRFAYIHI